MINKQTAGYSGTALEKKLGLKQGFIIRLYNAPVHYYNLFTNLPAGIIESNNKKIKKDFIHYFARNSSQLYRDIIILRQEIKENGMIWVSWYKKTAKMDTDLNEDIIRNAALSNGLVDVKVCAVDAMWSGLKLVIRLKDRK